MQRLPDFVVLDFLEWIKRAVLSDRRYLNIDLWDLFFDEKYDQLLSKKAEEYCYIRKQYPQDEAKAVLELILHLFCKSKYYDDFACEFRRAQRDDRDWDYAFHLLERALHHFYFDMRQQSPFLLDMRRRTYRNASNLQASRLIDSVKVLLQNYSSDQRIESPILHCMIEGLPVEIDFLEWVEREYCDKSELLKIDLMPLEVFEELADKFRTETGRDKSDVRKLVRLFKQSDPGTLRNRLYRLLSYESKYKKKNFMYVSQRYLSEDVLYKCVILPLENDEQYNKLISEYWTSLNKMSADYLDVYYCYANYGQSGYELMEELNYLPKKMHGKLPCILLWKNDMEQAGIITIKQLGAEEIFYVISYIVELIADGLELDDIIRRANKMSKEQKAKVVNNTITNYGNMGSAVIGDDAKVDVVFTAEGRNQFLIDAQNAHKIIAESDELNEAQKKELSSIITEAQEGVQEGSEPKAESSKKRFSSFMVFFGNTACKLISALSGLATIANFFGI